MIPYNTESKRMSNDHDDDNMSNNIKEHDVR